MMDNRLRKQRIMIAAITGIIIMVIIVVILLVRNALKNSCLNIYIAPISSSVIIDGKEYTNGTYDFYPGEYTAIVNADGFEKKEISFELEPHQYTNVFTYLTGENGDFSFYLQDGKLEDYNLLKQVAPKDDKAAQDFISRVEQIQSIKEVLPLVGWEYTSESNLAKSIFKITTVDQSTIEQCMSVGCLLVEYHNNAPSESLIEEKIVSAGYDFLDYHIIYKENV